MNIKLPAREDASVDMAPMIDLVFLLLIFFMVASVVTELDKVEVDIPKSEHAKVPEDTKGRMMLSIDANGQIYDGTIPVTINELKPRIVEELDMNPDLRILIRADRRVEYKTCKDLMIACADVGAADLIYATFEE
jgi:biopolymer transport protein ExbD